MAVTACVVAAAVPAFASGAGTQTWLAIFPGLADADGVYFSAYGPNATVDMAVRSMTHTRAYFNSASYYFNGVGFLQYDNGANKKLAYQISDSGGNYIYFISNATFQAYLYDGTREVVHAGMWRTSGGTWHFNWWGTNLNVGADVWNSYGANNVDQATMGADGWGGCRNDNPTNNGWDWIYRNKNNGYWYYFPAASNFAWGNTPTWSVLGDIVSQGTIAFGTVSCP